MLRGTVDVGARTVSYRRAGDGPAAVLVGALGHSSAADVSLIIALAATRTVVAIDPPGFGFSDPLTPGADDVAAIATATADTLTALGIDDAVVVGRHTGRPVAVELTLRDPARFPLLVLDDVPLLDADARAAWGRAYAAVVPVRDDGSHLVQHWYRRRREFVHAPWFDPTSTLDIDLTSPDVLDSIHAAVLDRLDAGDTHTAGERAVFDHDTVAALRATTAHVVAPAPSHPSLGSPGDVRADISVPPCAAEPADRRAAVVTAVTADAVAAPPRVVEPQVTRGRWTAQFPVTPWGQVAARRFRPSSGSEHERPLVLLHASPLSGESLLPLARELAAHREVVVLDTLGNGDSDKPDPDRHPHWREPEIADLAKVALAAVATLGIDHYDVFATHTGAMIALEMGIAEPERIGALVLDGLPLLDRGATSDLTGAFHVDLAPRWDGGHLVAAWSNVVDVLTWYPWHRRDPGHRRSLRQPSADVLHRRVVQMLKSGVSYVISSSAVTRHDTVARLPLLRVPVAFCRAPADPMAVYTERCLALAERAEALDVALDHPADAQRITEWLGDHAAAARLS